MAGKKLRQMWEADRLIDGQRDNREGTKEQERVEKHRRINERRCEKQKNYPLDSRCPSNRLGLVGWLVAGLEAG